MAENTLTPFKRAEGEDTEERLRILQENLERCLAFIDQCPIIDGRLIEDVTLSGGVDITVQHGLGRVPRGWVVVTANLSRNYAETSKSTTALVLQAGGAVDVVVDLWVF